MKETPLQKALKKEAIENLEIRASKMCIEGNTPTPRWWLDRIKEILSTGITLD